MPTGIPYASDYFPVQSTPAAQQAVPFTVTICLSAINIGGEGLNGIIKTSFSSRRNPAFPSFMSFTNSSTKKEAGYGKL